MLEIARPNRQIKNIKDIHHRSRREGLGPDQKYCFCVFEHIWAVQHKH